MLALIFLFAHFENMKTTVEIPDKELKALMKITGAKTKKEAINEAIREHNRRAKTGKLIKRLGTLRSIMSPAELEQMRRAG